MHTTVRDIPGAAVCPPRRRLLNLATLFALAVLGCVLATADAARAGETVQGGAGAAFGGSGANGSTTYSAVPGTIDISGVEPSSGVNGGNAVVVFVTNGDSFTTSADNKITGGAGGGA